MSELALCVLVRVTACVRSRSRHAAYFVAHGTLERTVAAVGQRVSIQIPVVAKHLATCCALQWARHSESGVCEMAERDRTQATLTLSHHHGANATLLEMLLSGADSQDSRKQIADE